MINNHIQIYWNVHELQGEHKRTLHFQNDKKQSKKSKAVPLHAMEAHRKQILRTYNFTPTPVDRKTL
jgi:hypothetical protein